MQEGGEQQKDFSLDHDVIYRVTGQDDKTSRRLSSDSSGSWWGRYFSYLLPKEDDGTHKTRDNGRRFLPS